MKKLSFDLKAQFLVLVLTAFFAAVLAGFFLATFFFDGFALALVFADFFAARFRSISETVSG